MDELSASAPADLCQGVRQLLFAIMGKFAEASCADRGPQRAFAAAISPPALGVSIYKPCSLRLAKLLHRGWLRIACGYTSLAVERTDEGLIGVIEANV